MDVLDLVEQAKQPAGTAPFVAFADWQPDEMAALRDLGSVLSFDTGTMVIAHGPADDRAMYIVIDGELQVVRGGQNRDVLRPGDLFGEMSFVDGQPRSASVHALVPSKALRVRPEDVDRLVERAPRIALKFMLEIARILSFRLRAAWG